MLLGYAGASAASGSRFGIAPSPGWYLYGRVAQFADCHRFTPPPGTSPLCQNTPPAKRPSGYNYMFDPHGSPAAQITHGFGTDDSLLRGWADRALIAQFGDFLLTGWSYLRSYYVPSSLPARLKGSTFLDPQLDFTNGGNMIFVAVGLESLWRFFDKFSTHQMSWGLHVLRDWQVVIRFGATALFVTTILVLIGLVIGTPRSRFGVILFGVGGLSLLLAPALTSTYSGRYTVPMGGPLIAASAITLTEIYRALVRWRHERPRSRMSVAWARHGH